MVVKSFHVGTIYVRPGSRGSEFSDVVTTNRKRRYRWEDIIKVALRQVWYERTDYIQLAQEGSNGGLL
jgi:hypothetical protein